MSGISISNRPLLPTRILDVADYPTSARLVVPNGKKAKYVALSYCWGGKSQVQTTKETLELHQGSISCADLPKTICDAIWVTKQLGMRFLWVDCLCIIQGDQEDFDTESTRMAAVYENAYLTIAATAAETSAAGIFCRSPQAEYVAIPCKPGEPSLGNFYLGLHKEPDEMVFDSPLNRRSWVLQEHLFSRRTIHFAQNQLYWECGEVLVGENNCKVTCDADASFPNRSMLLHNLHGYKAQCVEGEPRKRNPMFTEAEIYGIWARLVSYYSKRGLTDERDKLPAILSLSLEIQHSLQVSRWPFRFHQGILFGVPYFELECLLWCAKRGDSLRKPERPRASSWSWASVEGATEFLSLCITGQRFFDFIDMWTPHASDLRVLVVREHQAAGGRSREAITLSGAAIECINSEGSTNRDDGSPWIHVGCVRTQDGKQLEVELTYDVADSHPTHFWLIPAFVRPSKCNSNSLVYLCLMAREVLDGSSNAHIFEKIGVGSISDVSWVSQCDRQSFLLI